MVTHRELDILEGEVKRIIGSISINKGSEGDRILAELLKILKMMLLKCCTQYASKFEKLSSGHKTKEGQFSFQPQRRAMPKDVQTTVQLHSFHMLARLSSTSFKLNFSSIWTKNFQMYMLGFTEPEEPEFNYQHSLHRGESTGIPGKHLLLLHWLC